MKLPVILMMFAIVLAQDCNRTSTDNTNTDTPNNTGEVMKVIEMVKNPCFGQCPVYALSIYNDGTVEYDGQRFTNKMGKYAKKIPIEQVETLLKELEAIKFWEMKNVYPSNLPDLAKTNITLYRKDKNKTVTGDTYRPKELLAIDNKMVAIADSEEGWILKEKHPDAKDLPDHFIKNEIIAKFNKSIDIPDYITSLSEYDLQIKKRVAPNLDLWLLTFDTTKIDPALMLLKLKDAPEVDEASFNKQLSPRDH